ncbi:hypothetical protein BDA96_02G258800 [Sorghum bicolor]|uniref:Uncharacterized protein n=2 Tax=Sorghum bicolor TaxID=4558 RepID=A0A921UU33_SORBI|nr:hypothetical protein BDA96_02G258800 [Sorghum bicolor]OQU89691.1 hypothetical protein SORBI_3002G247401 [Sorghum bicolor]
MFFPADQCTFHKHVLTCYCVYGSSRCNVKFMTIEKPGQRKIIFGHVGAVTVMTERYFLYLWRRTIYLFQSINFKSVTCVAGLEHLMISSSGIQNSERLDQKKSSENKLTQGCTGSLEPFFTSSDNSSCKRRNRFEESD